MYISIEILHDLKISQHKIIIINLIFITSEMTRHMIKCAKDDRLKHESDHLSITTEFFMNSISQIVQKKQSWKKMNKKKIAAEAQHL